MTRAKALVIDLFGSGDGAAGCPVAADGLHHHGQQTITTSLTRLNDVAPDTAAPGPMALTRVDVPRHANDPGDDVVTRLAGLIVGAVVR
jgi:hypothetical protein